MPAKTRSADHHHHEPQEGFGKQRLVLCFDGTGNNFQGGPGDTNIVKIYNMLDRGNLNQMHYYQPGIGTYPAEGPVNVGFFRGIQRKIEAVLDQALATSFDSHVMAGYRFLMRYYRPGDKIYVFGFSRGAFTARFLARMISHIGLLSRGNEELVPFAYQVYQKYEQNRGSETERTESTNYMNAFKKHFCRTERPSCPFSDDEGDEDEDEYAGNGGQGEQQEELTANESGIKVHFLGLFDCVNSVGTLDVPMYQKPPPLPAVRGTARHVRHAVAIDERRVKFKAALFAQEQTHVPEDIKEVWFAGDHSDIGGGWSRAAEKVDENVKQASPDDSKDYFQLSDVALKWMIDELDDVEKKAVDAGLHEDGIGLRWDRKEKRSFYNRFEEHKHDMVYAKVHDTMAPSGGADKNGLFGVALWHFLEYFPFIRRWEFVKAGPGVKGGYEWSYDRLPLNKGQRRDIPSTALFHHSVLQRMQLSAEDGRGEEKEKIVDYLPTNHIFVSRGKKRKSQSGRGVDEPTAAEELHDHKLKESTLDNLAGHYKKPRRAVKHHLKFVYDRDMTIGGDEWDRIYHVTMDKTQAGEDE